MHTRACIHAFTFCKLLTLHIVLHFQENNAIDITRFIKEELKLTAEDAVVVKMDIGWDPWHILPGTPFVSR